MKAQAISSAHDSETSEICEPGRQQRLVEPAEKIRNARRQVQARLRSCEKPRW
jgi:hypothetical protein